MSGCSSASDTVYLTLAGLCGLGLGLASYGGWRGQAPYFVYLVIETSTDDITTSNMMGLF